MREKPRIGQGADVRVRESTAATWYFAVRSLQPAGTPVSVIEYYHAQLDHYFYHTAASCLARAGDCRGAWEAFQVRFPADVLKTVTDPAVRANIIETSFDSVVQKCKGKR